MTQRTPGAWATEAVYRIRHLFVPAAQGLLAIAGIGISGYLTVIHYQGSEPLCGGVGNCGLVQHSSYAEVGGIPVALLGLLGYLSILSLCLLRLWPRDEEWIDYLPLAVFGLALAAFAYSAYLTYVELFILKAICLWCVASAIIVTAIFALATVEVAGIYNG